MGLGDDMTWALFVASAVIRPRERGAAIRVMADEGSEIPMHLHEMMCIVTRNVVAVELLVAIIDETSDRSDAAFSALPLNCT